MPVNTKPKRYRFTYVNPDGSTKVERGWVIEEVFKDYKTWTPAIQYLVSDEGAVGLRFCYYRIREGKRGRLVRIPPRLTLDVIRDLHKELKESHAVKSLLKELIE